MRRVAVTATRGRVRVKRHVSHTSLNEAGLSDAVISKTDTHTQPANTLEADARCFDLFCNLYNYSQMPSWSSTASPCPSGPGEVVYLSPSNVTTDLAAAVQAGKTYYLTTGVYSISQTIVLTPGTTCVLAADPSGPSVTIQRALNFLVGGYFFNNIGASVDRRARLA